MTTYRETTVEVRVHGIGDHDDMSALGSPTVVSPGNRVVVAAPPRIPAHPMRMVNWSRTSRGTSRGLLWYLAFPFTLVNTAGNMGHPGQGRRSPRTGTFFVSVLLTVAAAMWMVVIVETVLKSVPLPGAGAQAGRVVAVAVPVVLAIWIVVRARRQGEVRPFTVGAHVAALVVFGCVGALLPAQVAFSSWPSILAPARGQAVERLDATTVIVLATTALTVLCAGGVMLVRRSVTDTAARSSLAMASLLLVMAMALMHTISSLLRMAVSWLCLWLLPVRSGDPRVLNFHERALMPYHNDDISAAPRLDLIPLYGLTALLSLAVVALVVIRFSPGGPGRRPAADQTGAARAKWVHRLVTTAPVLLGRICVWSSVVMIAAVAWLTAEMDDLMSGRSVDYVVLLIQVLTAFAAMVVLLRSFPRVRATMSLVADLAGFWPIQYHPLAGVSYREAALGGIDSAIRESGANRVVLVGHSQGSVLCAWWVRHRPVGRTVDLVTCGSPLESLYAKFFPRHVDPEFFARTRQKVRAWQNFWRDTDPISTPLPIAVNKKLVDPGDRDRVWAHGNYWIDEVQTGWIEDRMPAAP